MKYSDVCKNPLTIATGKTQGSLLLKVEPEKKL